jgi:uncharacterized membrane protein
MAFVSSGLKPEIWGSLPTFFTGNRAGSAWATRRVRPPPALACRLMRRPDLLAPARQARTLWAHRAGRLALAALVVLVALTAVGLAVLWPSGREPVQGSVVAGNTDGAKILSVQRGGCEQVAGPRCRLIRIRLTSGRWDGRTSIFTMPDDKQAPPLSPGDRVRVLRNLAPDLPAAVASTVPPGEDPAQQDYVFVDFERGVPLVLLAVLFVTAALVLGRGQGFRALLGLAVSLLIVVKFVLPSLLDGNAPVPVALAGASAVMLAVILLSHGLRVTSVAALLGTAASLLLTVGLAELFVNVAHITGLSSEEASLLSVGVGEKLSLQGLVLAGIVIGALGVLDDVTISQASTVVALRRANPGYHARRLYREAVEVGRDHVGATVNTLVLAYAGASLPLLLIFATQTTGLGEVLQRELVAGPIVATLVGSIGLMAAMPVTTALAAALAARLPAEALPDDEHVHHH